SMLIGPNSASMSFVSWPASIRGPPTASRPSGGRCSRGMRLPMDGCGGLIRSILILRLLLSFVFSVLLLCWVHGTPVYFVIQSKRLWCSKVAQKTSFFGLVSRFYDLGLAGVPASLENDGRGLGAVPGLVIFVHGAGRCLDTERVFRAQRIAE